MFSEEAQHARNRAMPYIRMKGYEASQVKGQFVVRLRPVYWNKPAPPPIKFEIFVRNLNECVLEDELFPIFESLGGLYEFRLMLRFSGHNRGMAFALYSCEATYQNALRELHHRPMRGNCILEATGSYNKRYIAVNDIPQRCGLSTIGNMIYTKTFNIDEIRAIQNGDTYNVAIKYETHLCAAMARKILACELKETIKHLSAEWVSPQQEHLIDTYNILITKGDDDAMIITETFPVPQVHKEPDVDKRNRRGNYRAITGKKFSDHLPKINAMMSPIKESKENVCNERRENAMGRREEYADKFIKKNCNDNAQAVFEDAVQFKVSMSKVFAKNNRIVDIDENNNMFFDSKFIKTLGGEERRLYELYFQKNLSSTQGNKYSNDVIVNTPPERDEYNSNATPMDIVQPLKNRNFNQTAANGIENLNFNISSTLLNPNAAPFSKLNALFANEAMPNDYLNFNGNNKKPEQNENLLLKTLLDFNENDVKFARKQNGFQNVQSNSAATPITFDNEFLSNYKYDFACKTDLDSSALCPSVKNFEKLSNGIKKNMDGEIQNYPLKKNYYEQNKFDDIIQGNGHVEGIKNGFVDNFALFDTNFNVNLDPNILFNDVENNGKTLNGNGFNVNFEPIKEEPNCNILLNTLLNTNGFENIIHPNTEVKPFSKGLIKKSNDNIPTFEPKPTNLTENIYNNDMDDLDWILLDLGEEVKQNNNKK